MMKEVKVYKDGEIVSTFEIDKIMFEDGVAELDLDQYLHLKDMNGYYHVYEFCCANNDNCDCDQEARCYLTIEKNVVNPGTADADGAHLEETLMLVHYT